MDWFKHEILFIIFIQYLKRSVYYFYTDDGSPEIDMYENGIIINGHESMPASPVFMEPKKSNKFTKMNSFGSIAVSIIIVLMKRKKHDRKLDLKIMYAKRMTCLFYWIPFHSVREGEQGN